MSKNTNLSFLTDYITADITNGRIGINNASPTVAFDVVGATKITGVLTLTSTISNGTYAYTLPSATGTLALTSALSGTTNYVAKFTSSSAIGNSLIFDNGTNVGINTTAPVSILSLSSDNPIISLTRNDNAASARAAINFYAVSNFKWQIGTNQISATTGFEFNFAGTNVALMNTAGSMGFGTNQLIGNVTAAQVTPNLVASRSLIAITTGGNYGNIIGSGAEKYLDLSYYGFNNVELARIRSNDESNVATIGTLTFWTLPAGGSVTERMRITSAGNVGIGTTSPSSLLHLSASGYPSIKIQGGATGGGGIQCLAGSDIYAEIYGEYGSSNNGVLIFRTRGAGTVSERMRITSGGNVGIGTTTPAEKLDVNGVIKAASLLLTGTYTTSISTSGAWTSAYQTVIPTGTLQAYYTYLISVHFTNSGAGQPYEVAASLLFSPAVTNGSGSDGAFIPLPSTHTGGSGAYFTFVSIAGAATTSGLRVLFTNFTNPTGTFYIKATRLQYPT
jgi:hypothetical protein